MFCEKCGAPNADDAKFCEKCGNVMTAEESAVQAVPKQEFTAQPYTAGETVYKPQPEEKKPMSLKNKIILIAVAAVLILCTAFYFVGKSATDPKKIVEKFMDGLVKGNYEQIYDCFEIPEGQFTTKEMFAQIIEQEMDDEEIEIDDYSIRETNESSKLRRVYEVEMKEKGSSYIDTEEIVLIKQKGKSWLFFDTYRMENDELVEKDVDFYVPAVATIKINGVAIDEKYKVDEGVGEKQYRVDYMFGGSYNYVVESPYTEPSEGEFSPAYDDFHCRYLDMNGETVASLRTSAEKILNDICAAAKDGKTWDEVKSYFAEEVSDAKHQYEDLYNRFHGENGTGIKTFNITGINKTSDDEDLEYGECELEFRYNYDYTYLYQTHTGGPIETSDNVSDSNAWFEIAFLLENGEWKPCRFDFGLGFDF
mgnify:CR=1 FL=1